jgi:hypothetical protein
VSERRAVHRVDEHNSGHTLGIPTCEHLRRQSTDRRGDENVRRLKVCPILQQSKIIRQQVH